MAQLMPLPLTVCCFSKIQIGFAILVPAYPGSPGQMAVKRVCVCDVWCVVVMWRWRSPVSLCPLSDGIPCKLHVLGGRFSAAQWYCDGLQPTCRAVQSSLAHIDHLVHHLRQRCVNWFSLITPPHRGRGCHGSLWMEEDDKGCPTIRMGVSGWMFFSGTGLPG